MKKLLIFVFVILSVVLVGCNNFDIKDTGDYFPPITDEDENEESNNEKNDQSNNEEATEPIDPSINVIKPSDDEESGFGSFF